MNDLYSQISSMEVLHEAYMRVSEHHGCRGSDGVTIVEFGTYLMENLQQLSEDLKNASYHPYPLLRFPVPKRHGQVPLPTATFSTHLPTAPAAATTNTTPRATSHFRYLSVPTVRDRIAQTAAFLVTKDLFEAEFETISHAYREGRGVRTAVYAIKDWAKKGYRHAVDADIDDYFDNIDHPLLLQKLTKLISDKNLIRLFEKWIKVEVYDGQRIWVMEKGIPQGSVVSPYLANLFLDELDETLMAFGLKLVRYADDFLILCKTSKEAEDAIEITDMLLEDMHLDLNPLKTKIVSFDKGFKFLGAIFLSDGVFLPYPEKKKEHEPPHLPPPLTLKRYLELKNK